MLCCKRRDRVVVTDCITGFRSLGEAVFFTMSRSALGAHVRLLADGNQVLALSVKQPLPTYCQGEQWVMLRHWTSSGCCNWLLRKRRPFNLTYLLTPRSRILLEKLTFSQLVKKFPAFYGTRRFITAFVSGRHLSLSWARSIQSMPLHPTSFLTLEAIKRQMARFEITEFL